MLIDKRRDVLCVITAPGIGIWASHPSLERFPDIYIRAINLSQSGSKNHAYWRTYSVPRNECYTIRNRSIGYEWG